MNGSPLIVLALDLATRFGWAIDDGSGQKPLTGSCRLPPSNGEYGNAGATFARWLRDMIAVRKPALVAIEAPLMGGPGVVMNANTARLLIGLAFLAETIAHEAGVPCLEEHVQTVRKGFLGHGRPDHPKRAVMEKCALLGWKVGDDNAADAAALWYWAKARRDRSFVPGVGTRLFPAEGVRA